MGKSGGIGCRCVKNFTDEVEEIDMYSEARINGRTREKTHAYKAFCVAGGAGTGLNVL